MLPTCPLCNSQSTFFYTYLKKDYFSCTNCKSVFVDPKKRLEYEDEESRYLEHNNDIHDPGYQDFVKPILDIVLAEFNPSHKGLDFGAGTGPVLSKLLIDKGYSVDQYDPFFCNNPTVFSQKYDFIVCCEVIEHFYHPSKEFLQLNSMLNPGGKLICMTDLYDESVDFAKWYYKNDPTHVFFYHPNSISFIQNQFGFTNSFLNKRLLWFSR